MNLFTKYRLGDLELSNRIIMAPMTRCRAIEGNVPNPLAVTYYMQRASAGLIISEGSQISPLGMGIARTPGIYSRDQVGCWKKVTDAVHKAGGKIFLQLWHVGRVSHPDLLEDKLPVAPSALSFEGEVRTPDGKKRFVIPRALEPDEIPDIIRQFRDGAQNARDAGFDGVEIHGANGYLLDQFLRDGSNHRADKYGGSLENRVRLPLEVTEAVAEIWGHERVGYRISPHFSNYSMSDTDPRRTYSYFAEELNEIGIGYLHMIEPVGGRLGVTDQKAKLAPVIHDIFEGTFMLNGGYDANSGNEAIEKSEADLISFGVPFLANPDLPERFRKNAPLNSADVGTFYMGEEKGYVDYPRMGD